MPVQMVNGYPCKDCTDVSNAKKHIDPRHPKDGPYGVNAKTDPSSPAYDRDTAVTFGGVLSSLTANPVKAASDASGAASPDSAAQKPPQPLSQQTGGLINLLA